MMQQLAQKLKDGVMKTIDVPWPSLSHGSVLVRNHYSLISAGTEASTVKTARKGLLGKAKERPQQVKQVFDVLKSQGIVQTYRAVLKKLDALSPLGYSCVGEVLEVAGGVENFQAGDYVACGGLSACHAEVVAVPVNLCVKVNINNELGVEKHLKTAAYNTLGAIAMQGVRQADLRLGETCGVIGLGLLGQITCSLLRASGIRVIGIDVDERAVNSARKHCADLACLSGSAGVAASIDDFTQGLGCDSVIITAATNSLEPINFAGEISRKRGRVVIVGAVPTGFDRDPHYYRKELELRMSCSYGPGRYDINYEEKGIDYPPAYVRWTENRNMQAFQDLIRTGKINLDFLTSHEFALEDAPQAYDMIVNHSEPFLGILIRYDVEKPVVRQPVAVTPLKKAGRVGLAFIGAGSYAQGSLLPNLPKGDDTVVNKAVLTSSGTSSKSVADKFGFEFCTSEKNDIFADKAINTVFISTRHNTHAEYVMEGLQAEKHIFVEKPLCLTMTELETIRAIHAQTALGKDSAPALMVGFNRRFAPLIVTLKSMLGQGPVSMMYRVNAGAIPADNWIQDTEVGGGRIVGEVCHFIDLMTFMSGSLPVRVAAFALPDPQNCHDTVAITVEFANGSVGNIGYFANGSKSLAKEYIEVYQGGVSGILKDFKELEVYGKGKPFRKKLFSQDKGQKAMLEAFLLAIKNGTAQPISVNEIFCVTRTTFAVLESLQQKVVVSIS